MFDVHWENFKGLKFRSKAKSKIANTPSESNYKHNNFELLALEIVKNKTSNDNWEHTEWSGDGNHDGTLCIALYNDIETKWWMESKYSYSLDIENLTRYRLDATIVSKIIEEQQKAKSGQKVNIERIYIVTNQIITAKVQNDIKLAVETLRNNCLVKFIQRDDIEYWFFTNPHRYRVYFNGEKSFDSISLDELYIGNDIQIYPETEKTSNFHYSTGAPIILTKGQKYIVSVNYFSAKNQECKITAPNGIKIITNDAFEKGKNILKFVFRVTKNLSVPLAFTVNNKEISPIDYQYEDINLIRISSHKIIKKAISEYVNTDYVLPCSCFFVLGKNATGKSTLLKQIIAGTTQQYINFSLSDDFGTNIKYFINYISFLLLPCVSWKDIDLAYINSLKKRFGCGFDILHDLLKLENLLAQQPKDDDAIIEFINKLSLSFPDNLSYSQTLLYLDNIQRLGKIDGLFFQKIVERIAQSALKVKIVVFGNTYFQDNPFFKTLNKYRVSNKKYSDGVLYCDISNPDIINHINKLFHANVSLDFNKSLFTDLIEINQFIKFAKKNKLLITDNPSFLQEFSRYKNNDQAVTAIKTYINNCLAKCNDAAKTLLNNIYYSPHFIPVISENESEETSKAKKLLLRLNLVKRGFDGNTLEPYHETYRNIYFKFFTENCHQLENYNVSEQENLIIKFNFPRTSNEQIAAAKELFSLRHKKPGTVLYALEPKFSRIAEMQEQLLNELGINLFFQLYEAYADVCGYSSTNIAGIEVHRNLIDLAKGYSDYGVRRVVVDSLGTILDNLFGSIEFEQADEVFEELIKKYKELAPFIDKSDKEWLIRLLHAHTIKAYINCTLERPEAEKNFCEIRKAYRERLNNYFHYLECGARFAQILYTSDIEKAYEYTCESIELMKNTRVDDKQIKEISFQYDYILMLKNNDASYLPGLIKRYYDFSNGFQNKQRKVQCALISACLKFGDINTAKDLLENEIRIIQPRNKRLEMFFGSALALYSLIVDKNHIKALQDLENTIKLVDDIPSFARIIQHNIDLLKRIRSVPNQYEFALSKDLQSDVYYIDPRADR